MTQTQIPTATPAGPGGWRAAVRRGLAALVLRAHRTAQRFELTPADFGAAGAVDESSAAAVSAEWLRLLRLWADYNPEGVFALKVGAVMLAAALVALWIGVAMIR